MLELYSARLFRISLNAIHNGSGGLDAHRQSIIDRVPCIGDWAKFPVEHLSLKDLAYLTAKTGHEFAILRGKDEDILFHGSELCCTFDDVLVDMLLARKLSIFGHSHPGEDFPIPSPQDRETLKQISQTKSSLISGRTGIVISFSADIFED